MAEIPFTRLLAAWLCVLLSMAWGCDDDAGDAARAPQANESEVKSYDVYTVQGRVERLPVEGQQPPQVRVHHEAIEGFRDRSGKQVGMAAMTMPFAVAPGVSLAGIEPGDRVEMRFEVRWQQTPPLWITRLEEVPAAQASGADAGGGPPSE